MSNGAIEFLGFWGFVLSVIFVGLQIYYNRRLIKAQLEIAQKQNETQIQIAKEQFETQRAIAERQFKIEVLSRNRQEWINNLRDTLAEFVGLLLMLSEMPEYEDLEEQDRIGELEENIKQIESCAARVRLMLNMKEKDHEELDDCVTGTMLVLRAIDAEKNKKKLDGLYDTLESGVDEIVKLSRSILKREWERVKKGE